MREPIITENFTLKTQFINAPKIGGVPEDYGRDGKLEAGSPVSLIIEGRIADAASVLVNAMDRRHGARWAKIKK